MEHHVLDSGQGQHRMRVKPHRPVPHEATAVAVVAGQMVLRRRLPEPEPVVSGRAGTRDAGVVPQRGLELRAAFRQGQHTPPRLADNVGQPGNLRPGKAGRQ